MVVGDHMDFETTVRLEITVVLFAVIQQYQNIYNILPLAGS